MGHVLRILGIIAISMVMGLVALFLLLFTICGGFRRAGPEEAALVIGCVVVILGGVAALVWLGRGLTRALPARSGLAVPPSAGAGAAAGPYVPAETPALQASAPAAARPRLRGKDFQWLVLLRVALAAYAFLIFGSTAISYVSMMQVSAGFALPMFAGATIGLAPFLLVLLLLRDPPSPLALDLAAGMAAGSIVFRILWSVFMSLTWRADAMAMPAMLGRLVVFSAVEAAIVVLALQLRKSVEPGTWGRLVAIGAGFAVWEWISQTLVSLLYRFAY
jgi:hypothetical protein